MFLVISLANICFALFNIDFSSFEQDNQLEFQSVEDLLVISFYLLVTLICDRLYQFDLYNRSSHFRVICMLTKLRRFSGGCSVGLFKNF